MTPAGSGVPDSWQAGSDAVWLGSLPNPFVGLSPGVVLGAVETDRADSAPALTTAAPVSGADGVAVGDDCVPLPPAKPKPKPIAKRALSDTVPERSKSFSQQLDGAVKRFRAPAKVAPRPPAGRQC